MKRPRKRRPLIIVSELTKIGLTPGEIAEYCGVEESVILSDIEMFSAIPNSCIPLLKTPDRNKIWTDATLRRLRGFDEPAQQKIAAILRYSGKDDTTLLRNEFVRLTACVAEQAIDNAGLRQKLSEMQNSSLLMCVDEVDRNLTVAKNLLQGMKLKLQTSPVQVTGT